MVPIQRHCFPMAVSLAFASPAGMARSHGSHCYHPYAEATNAGPNPICQLMVSGYLFSYVPFVNGQSCLIVPT